VAQNRKGRTAGHRPNVLEVSLRAAATRELRLRLLRERSLVEGVWYGRKAWLAVAAVVWGVHGINKARHREESVLLREVLRPGEHVIIRQAITRPTRRQRRKAGNAVGTSGPG
jgi:hypothetical protein